MEYHPEEYHYCKDKQQCHDTCFGLFGSEFLLLLGCGCSGFGVDCGSLFFIFDDMCVRATSEKVDQKADHKRCACKGERIRASGGKCSDIFGRKRRQRNSGLTARCGKVMEITGEESCDITTLSHAFFNGKVSHGFQLV